MTEPRRPYRALVAVVAYHLDGSRVARWPDGGYGVPAPYLDALRRAGARTAIVSPGEDGDPEELLEPFDGLLLVGGGDVDPTRYGAEPDTEHNYGVEQDRDAFEVGLLRAADRMHLPTLCICRGMQLMNVAFGGTLHQHLPGMPGLLQHGVPMEGTDTLHLVAPEPGTLLSATTKTETLTCSSHHHQGVDRVGAGLLVTGRSPDGLVEAIELAGADGNESGAHDLDARRAVAPRGDRGERPRSAGAVRCLREPGPLAGPARPSRRPAGPGPRLRSGGTRSIVAHPIRGGGEPDPGGVAARARDQDRPHRIHVGARPARPNRTSTSRSR